MTRFQIIFTGVLVLAAIVGLILFSIARTGGKGTDPVILIWGTVPRESVQNYFYKITNETRSSLNVTYVEKDPKTFDRDFVEALALGAGPDAIFVPQNEIFRQKNKLFAIPFATISERQYKDTFIQGAELMLGREGIYSLPLFADPLVLYWNRDMYSDAGLAVAPKTWTDVASIVPKLRKSKNGVLQQSSVALGEWSNVAHAKEIYSALVLQAGNPIVKISGDNVRSVLEERLDLPYSAGEAALSYYTQFANPTDSHYSWNRSLPNSFDAFTGEKLATYIGFASDFSRIGLKNSNLNFDIAMLPELANAKTKIVFGNMYGFAIVKNSKKIDPAFAVVKKLVSADFAGLWTEITGLPPVRKDLLLAVPSDVTAPIFYASALRTRAWYDPNTEETSAIFRRMVERAGGGGSPSTEVERASAEIDDLLSL